MFGPADVAGKGWIMAVLPTCEVHAVDLAEFFARFGDQWGAGPIESMPDVIAALEDQYFDQGYTYWIPA